MADQVSVEITVEEKQALRALTQLTKGVDKVEKNTIKSVKTMDLAFASFAGNLAANVAGKAISGMISGIRSMGSAITEFVGLASVQEDAVNDLNSALVRNGEYSAQTSRELQSFASQLQAVTKYGDEAILSQIAFAQSMGASANQSKEILTAATDMAASLNIDLNSAVRNISKTLGGYAGELGEVIPELKGLTQEQLRAGDGVKLLAQRFAGAASSQISTFRGALAQTSNIFGDLKESIGATVTQSPVVIAAFRGLSKGLQHLDKIIKDNSEGIRTFAESVLVGGLVNGIQFAGQAIVKFNGFLTDTKNFLSFLVDASLGAMEAFLKFRLAMSEAGSGLREFMGMNTEAANQQEQAIRAQITSIEQARLLNDQAASERIARQEEVAAKVTETTDMVVSKINQELEAQRTASDEKVKILQSEKNKKGNIKNKEMLEDKKRLKQSYFYEKAFKERTNREKVEGVKNSLGAIATLQQSSSKELFTIGKIAALADHGINSAKAVSKAYASAPPPFSFILAGLVGAAMAAQGAKIASAKPPAFADGGVIGGFSGATLGGDNAVATVRTGEMVLNANQQRQLFEDINTGQGGRFDELLGAVREMASSPVVVSIDGKEIARANRTAMQEGFA